MIVAVVGAGAMGGRMAARLRGAGHDVREWRRSSEATVAEVVAGADAAIAMVPDAAALRSVADGLAGARVVVVTATVGPAAVKAVAEALPVPVLDVPVLGSLAEAEAGTLTLFVGGVDGDVAAWLPLLEVLGTPIRAGGVGAGQAAKLVANDALLAAVAALGEAIALADRLGLSREQAWEVLAATPLAAQAERRRAAVDTGSYPPRFRLALARKDAELIAAAAPELPLAAAVRQWLAQAERNGRGGDDYTALLAEILAAGR